MDSMNNGMVFSKEAHTHKNYYVNGPNQEGPLASKQLTEVKVLIQVTSCKTNGPRIVFFNFFDACQLVMFCYATSQVESAV